MNEKLEVARQRVSVKLDQIREVFKPGAKIAVAVWFPGKPEYDFVLVDPSVSINDAIATLERRRDACSPIDIEDVNAAIARKDAARVVEETPNGPMFQVENE